MGKKLFILVGVTCLFQAVTQIVMSTLAILQYFCIIDFLWKYPQLIYLRILYFHSPRFCGSTVNIGQAIEGVANQAFVLLENVPFTAKRTLIINFTFLALGFIWIIANCILLAGGARNTYTRPTRWPFMAATVAVATVDVVAVVVYANDSLHTRTLSAIMKYIGGRVSGLSGGDLDTSNTSWIMVIIHSRVIIFFVLNMAFVTIIGLHKSVITYADHDTVEMAEFHVNVKPAPSRPRLVRQVAIESESNSSVSISFTQAENKTEEETTWLHIPRAYLNQAFQKIKNIKNRNNQESVNLNEQLDTNKKQRAVHFPENPLSLLPQRRESLIQENKEPEPIVPEFKSQSIAHPVFNRNCSKRQAVYKARGNVSQVTGRQVPWSYVPASTSRMRDYIHSDEDLPPVPLPDYTAIEGPSRRKSSVHRPPSFILRDMNTELTKQQRPDRPMTKTRNTNNRNPMATIKSSAIKYL